MAALGLVIDFGTGRVTWDGSEMIFASQAAVPPVSAYRGLS